MHVDFATPVTLSANEVYWVGMYGLASWTQAGLVGGTGALMDNQSARYDVGEFATFATDVGDTAFRLHGTPVPVPAAIWFLGSGLFGLMGLSRAKARERVRRSQACT